MATFPVVIKEGLRLIGQEAGDCQAPILPLNDAQRGKLTEILKEIQLI
jgi:dihydrodipicolinate synthase/N-acetylneuraminate lyase